MKVKIHHEGTNILVILALMLGVVNACAWLFISPVVLPIIFSAVTGVVFLLVLNFFRCPHRELAVPAAERQGLVVSSVDGTVVAVEETRETTYLHRRVVQVSVFMTVLNVHANWFPVDGTVEEVRHFRGRFMAANLPKASIENEHSSILIRTSGEPSSEVVVNQVAGALARRIVTYAEPGDPCSIDEHLGFIKFGSRVDIYLPLGTEILVRPGDKTTGGITPIARLK